MDRREKELKFVLSQLCVLRLILCMMVSCLLLTGCWDSRELDRLSFTAATAIDYKDDMWNVTYQVVNPVAISKSAPGGEGKLPINVFTTQGKTIREAVWQSRLGSTRQLYFSHTRTIVVSEAAAKQGLSQLIDVYFRNLDSRETVSVLIAAGEAKRILYQLMQLEILPGEAIEDMISGEEKEMSVLPNINMYKLGLSLLGTAKSAILPEILISESPPVTNRDDLSKSKLSSRLKLRRLAVLSQDKLVGWLPNNKALGVSFIRNEVHKTTIPFSCTETSREKDSTFRMTRSQTHLTPHKAGGHYVIDIEVKGKGVLLETNCQVDFNTMDIEHEMEKQLENEVSETIKESWQAVKELKTDVIGFADLIHRKYPKEWKQLSPNWQKEFSQIEINPKVDIILKLPGLTTKSFKTQLEQD